MQLPGRLDTSTLGDLLGTLYRGNATGVLELSEIAAAGGGTRHGRTHRIHLLSGLVASVETELEVTPIGQVLARAGKVDPRAIEVMLYRMAMGDARPAGAILVSMGAVAQEALVAGLRAQLHAKVDAIYKGLADARVTFRTSRPLPKDVLRVGTLMPRDFLHGRMRNRDRRAAPRAAQTPPPPAQQAKAPWWSSSAWGAKVRGAQETPAPASGGRGREASGYTSPPPPASGGWTHEEGYGSPPPPSSGRWAREAYGNASPPPPSSGRWAREAYGAGSPMPPPSTPRAQALRTLGLPLDADEVSVRRAFKKLALELHPDRFGASPEEVRAKLAARFAEASAAYHLLVA